MQTPQDLQNPTDTLDPTVSSRIVAACFAFAAFALAVLSGLFAGNPAYSVIGNALFWLIACYVIGLVIARIANIAVTERLAQYREERPIPVEEPVVAATDDAEPIEAEEITQDDDQASVAPAPPAQPVQAA